MAEAAGNPLALLELPKGRTWIELAAGVTPMATGPVTGRVEEVFGDRRAADLPPDSRRLLILVSADQLGDTRKIWRAAEWLNIPRGAAEPAEEAGLLSVGPDLHFSHPLVRSAIYRAASPMGRRDAHRALAEVTNHETDPDRRAWQLAAAAIGPDRAVSDELERSAGRAKKRGGVAAAAAFLERAAHLTPDPVIQALRCLHAAEAYLEAGTQEEAHKLLKNASRRLDDPVARAQAMRLDAAIRFAEGRGGETPTLFLDTARALREVDPTSAVDTLTQALEAATWAGDLGSGTTAREVAAAAAQLPDGDDERTATLLLKGYAARSTDYGRTVLLWDSAVHAGACDATSATRFQHLSVLFLATGDMLDFENHSAVANERVRVARADGALIELPGALGGQAWCQGWPASSTTPTRSTSRAQTSRTPSALRRHRGPTTSSAWVSSRGVGRTPRPASLPRRWRARRSNTGRGWRVDGRVLPDDARSGCRALRGGAGPRPYPARRRPALRLLAVPRRPRRGRGSACSMPGARGTAALARLQERADASGTPWGLGLLARVVCVLLADDSRAESLYLESLGASELRRCGDRLGPLESPSLVNRSGASADDWTPVSKLRTAERFFEATGAEGSWGGRLAELRATGEQGRVARALRQDPALSAGAAGRRTRCPMGCPTPRSARAALR